MAERASTSPPPENAELRIPALEGRARLRRIVILGFVAAAGVYAYVALTRKPEVAELYRTVPVERRSLVQAVEAAGRLDVESRVEVPAPIEGRIVAIHAKEGEHVELGQLLAELDPRAAALQVRSAEAALSAAAGGLAQAKAKKDEAARTLERKKNLVARGLVSPEELQSAEAQLTQASAALEAARGEQRVAAESVASAKLGQNLSRMQAPATGVLLKAPERLGAAVSPDAGPLFVIGSDLSTMRVDATVSETEVDLVKPGQTAEILVSALPEESFRGQVQRVFIEPELREGAVLYPVRLKVDNPEGRLLPGMTARARMEVAHADNVLSVHEAALRFTPPEAPEAPPRSRVWLRTGATELVPIPVRAGVSDGVFVQVESTGAQKLKEGDALAVGLLRPSEKAGPEVRLGDKKN